MSTDSDNPLGPLHRDSGPGLDDVTRDRIESGLRVQHAALRPASAGPRVPRWMVVGPVLALILVAATVALVLRDEAAVAALELRDAENVTVTLPDGMVVTDPADGFALIDGAVVVVGDDGRVTIDDVTLAAGTIVTIRDGRLVTDVIATTTTDRPDHRDDPDPPRDEPPADVGTASTTTVAPTTTTRPPDQPPDRPPVTTAPVVTPPDSRPPADTPNAPGHGDEVAVALRVSAHDGGVRVVWNAMGVEGNGWRVFVLRTTDGTEPTNLSSGDVIAEGVQGELLQRRADLPDEIVALRYRVVIVDEGDGIVARSAVHTLMPPGS